MRPLLASDYAPPGARDRHVDALASLRALPTHVLLGELAEFRRDAAGPARRCGGWTGRWARCGCAG